MSKKNYRELVSGLADLPTIVVGGRPITGSYLAMIVAMNPELLTKEACDTPQLICELGRLAAVAYRAKQTAESEYRIWRDGTVHQLCNNLNTAIDAGFSCASNPGTDAKGKPKPAKLPSTTAAEAFMRTLEKYAHHQTTISEKEEAWATVYAALEAAKQRTWVIKTLSPDAEVERDAESKTRLSMGGAFGDNNFSGDFSEHGGIVNSEGRTSPPPPPKVRRA